MNWTEMRAQEITQRVTDIINGIAENKGAKMLCEVSRVTGLTVYTLNSIRRHDLLPSIDTMLQLERCFGVLMDGMLPEYRPVRAMIVELLRMHDDENVDWRVLQGIYGLESPVLRNARNLYRKRGRDELRITTMQVLKCYEQMDAIRGRIESYRNGTLNIDVLEPVYAADETIFETLHKNTKTRSGEARGSRPIADEEVTEDQLYRVARRLYEYGVRKLHQTDARTIEGDTERFYHFIGRVVNDNRYELKYIFKRTGSMTRRIETL